MAESISINEKRGAVRRLVADAIRARVIALREQSDEHWNAIVAELFDAETIRHNNDLVTLAATNYKVATLLLNTDSYYSHDQQVVVKTNTIRPEDDYDESDPFDMIRTMRPGLDYAQTENMVEEMREIWKSVGALSFKTPIPMSYMTRAESNDDTVCNLNDEKDQSGAWKFDVEDVVPVDCTTKKTFVKAAKSIGADATSLYTTIMDAIRLARTDVAVIKAVPELAQYLTAAPGSTSVAAMLKQAIAG